MLAPIIIISLWVIVTLIYTITDTDIPKIVLILAIITIILSQVQILDM